MAFRLIHKTVDKGRRQFNENVKLVQWNDIEVIEVLGRGQFGEVSKIRYKKKVMSVKRLLSQSGDDRNVFLKEANIMASLNHQNVMELKGVCPERCAILMEFMLFDFTIFGGQETVSNLTDFLQYIHRIDMVKTFDFMQNISVQVASGLQYLHKKEIAHRDLKPSNVLVSNQHYKTSAMDLRENFKKDPIKVKLADFGESRSYLYHTNTHIQTRTHTFGRGTLPFMAPEVQENSDILPNGATVQDLCKADLWSLGQTLFCIMNPSLKYPHEINYREACKNRVHGKPWNGVEVLIGIVRKESPIATPEYMGMQSTSWLHIHEVYEATTKYDPSERLSLDDVITKLQVSTEPSVLEAQSMHCSQASALVNADATAAEKVDTSQPFQYSVPANDGTNACAFLSCMICDFLLSTPGGTCDALEIANKAATVVETGPLSFNMLRDARLCYGVDMAKEILEQKSIMKKCSIVQSDGDQVFSQSGRKWLVQAILALKDQTALYTCPPYVFTIHAASGIYYIIDTHPITAALGGDGSGIVVTFQTAKDTAMWVWKRLFVSGVQPNALQSMSVLERVASSAPHDRRPSVNFLPISTSHSKPADSTPLSSTPHNSGPSVGTAVSTPHDSRPGAGTPLSSTPHDSRPVAGNSLSSTPHDSRPGAGNSLSSTPHDSRPGAGNSLSSTPHDSRPGAGNSLSSTPHDSRPGAGNSLSSAPHDSRPGAGNSLSSTPHDSRPGAGNSLSHDSRPLPDTPLSSRSPPVDTPLSSTSHDIEQPVSTPLFSTSHDNGPSVSITHDSQPSFAVDESKEQKCAEEDNTCSVQQGQKIKKGKKRKKKKVKNSSHTGMACAEEAADESVSQYCKGCPVFKRTNGSLQMAEIIDIIICQKVEEQKVSKKVPLQVTEDSVFVIDCNNVDINDLTADDNGIYGRHSSPSQTIFVNLSDNTVLSHASDNAEDGKEFLVRRYYSWHQSNGMKRIVIKVYECDGKLRKLMPYVILQYKVDRSKERTNCLPSHKNSTRREPFVRTKPSVLKKIKESKDERPKSVVQKLTESAGGVLHASSPGDVIRDRRQVYNVLSKIPDRLKARNTGPNKVPDFNKLITSKQKGTFVKDVSFPLKTRDGKAQTYPTTFAATNEQLHWIKTFCNGKHPVSQVGIDTTYNVGPYFVVPMTFAHPMYVNKHNRKHPTIFLGMMTSVSRQISDYEYMAANLYKNNVRTLTYGTDGEYALEKGFENIFPIESDRVTNIHLRCFDHVKADIQYKMEELHIPNEEHRDIIEKIIGHELNGKRVEGLVDVSNEEFEEKMSELEEILPSPLIDWIKSTKFRVRSLEETIRKCMLKPVRVAAGLGNPPNKYDNQRSEAFNNVLKEVLKRSEVDQVSLHEHVESKVVAEQKDELLKAIFGMGEYRLSSEYQHLSVDHVQWFQMTYEQREAYAEKVLMHNGSPAKKRPYVAYGDMEIPNIPNGTLSAIWARASMIIENEEVMKPNVHDNRFCVIEGDESFIVKLQKESAECDCSTFKENRRLCQHVVVVCDKESKLPKYLEKLQRESKRPIQAMFENVPQNGGKKPCAKKRKGKNNVQKHPIVEVINRDNSVSKERPARFDEYYHNDEPFQLVFITDHSNAKRCESCRNNIPRKFLTIPYDIVFLHRERYAYPVKDDKGQFLRMTLTRNKMGDRYYCVKKECLLKRHPYFWVGRINVAKEVKDRLQQSHFSLLSATLDGYRVP